MPDPYRLTEPQAAACRSARLDPNKTETIKGKTLVIPYWGGEGLLALVNEHGSITYCPRIMLEQHLAGIPA